MALVTNLHRKSLLLSGFAESKAPLKVIPEFYQTFIKQEFIARKFTFQKKKAGKQSINDLQAKQISLV